jgi:hypothetical protein
MQTATQEDEFATVAEVAEVFVPFQIGEQSCLQTSLSCHVLADAHERSCVCVACADPEVGIGSNCISPHALVQVYVLQGLPTLLKDLDAIGLGGCLVP